LQKLVRLSLSRCSRKLRISSSAFRRYDVASAMCSSMGDARKIVNSLKVPSSLRWHDITRTPGGRAHAVYQRLRQRDCHILVVGREGTQLRRDP